MAIGKWIFAQPGPAVPDTPLPKPVPAPHSADEKQFGLENFGNTCYANSVLQALYFCSPFRDLVIQHTDPYSSVLSSHFAPTHPPTHPPTSPTTSVRRKPDRKSTQDPPPPNAASHSPAPAAPSTPRTLFSALRALYVHISQNPANKGTVAPRAFVEKLRELNEAFRNTMHQDAHEFLNYLLNRIVEEIEEEKRQRLASGDDLPHSMKSSSTASHPPVLTATTSTSSTPPSGVTFIHRIFEGTLTSETRCLTCENLSSRDESFLDLSIDIEQNSSVTACLRQFSASEMLCQKEKFFCDSCCDLQEAERRMKIKRLPNVLALHLKRFKYQEDVQKYIKLTYRVAFPLELRLFNTVDDIPNPDRLYELFAIVVHIGNGPNHGHYVSIIKTMGTWLIFDDDNVDLIKESDISKYFGDSNSGSAYVLYYQAVDIDLSALGLRSPSLEPVMQQSEPPQHSQTTDSPVSTAQSIPSLPPGLTDDLTSSTSVPEAHPRPTTPPIPAQSPLEPSGKSPRKATSQFFKISLGHKHFRNDTVVLPSQSTADEKFSTLPKQSLSPIAIVPKEDLKPLENHLAGAINGKEKDSDRSMMGWLRRRSTRPSKSRPSSEVNADISPLPQDVRATSGSPVRDHSTGSSSNSSKDSRRPLDSPTTGRTSPRVFPLSIGRPPQSRLTDKSPFETDSRQSSTSGGSHTTSISTAPGRHLQPRSLPVIPASPQTPKNETPSPLSRTSLDHSRTQRRLGVSSTADSSRPLPPKSPGRPATSAGAHTRIRSPLLGAPPSNSLQMPSPTITTGRLVSNNNPVVERPKSAHASYGFMSSPPTSPVPPVPVSTTIPTRKPGVRKLSLSAPMLGFVRHKEKQ